MKSTRREFLENTTMAFGALALTPATLWAQESETKSVGEEIGQPLSGWTEGNLDLHFIYTGAGENMFYIFPDGTTMILDAADRPSDQKDQIPFLPNESRLPSEWIARYIERVGPSSKSIDYMMLSHFHSDHAGCAKLGAGTTQGRGDDYVLSGLANLGELFSIGKIFDRKYPDYTFSELEKKDDGFENFHKYTTWKLKNGETSMEKFEVGALDQLALVKNREKYPDFHIRNLCANGVVYNRKDGGVIDFYARYPKNKRSENAMSIALLFSYGPFRFYTGGDVCGTIRDDAGNDVLLEGAVGQAAGPVDLCKTNHHSCINAMHPEFVRQVRPRVYVTNVWDYWHLQDNTQSTMCDESLYPGERLVCPTWVAPKRMEEYKEKPWQKYLKPAAGHVVVRVFDGGKRYKVYHLTAEDESMTVKAVFGPFEAVDKPFSV